MIKIINKTYISIIDKNVAMIDFSNSRGFKVVLGFDTAEKVNDMYSIFKDLYQQAFDVRVSKDSYTILVEATKNTKASINPQLNGYIIVFTTI